MASREDIDSAYRQLLGRDVDPSGLQTWSNPGIDKASLWRGISSSAEYNSKNDLFGFAKNQTQGYKDIIDSQNAYQQGLFDQFKNKLAGQETMTGAYGRLSKEAGVGELSAKVADLRNMITQLDQNITDRTKGTFTSEAQRNRMVAYEGSDLNKQLGAVGTVLSAAQQGIATQMGLISADQQKEMQPLIMQIDSLSDRFAREMTGYTQGKTTEFNALLAKIQRDQQLTDAEVARANQLADEESAWERTKEQMALEYSYSAKKSGAASSAKSDPTKNLRDDITKGLAPLIQANQNRSTPRPWATESLITQLANAYPEFTYEDIQNEVYNMRKPYEAQGYQF